MGNSNPMDVVRVFFRDLASIHSGFESLKTVEYPHDVTPQGFLDRAELDMNSGLPHASSNALANAKRALDSQLDYFLYSYGLSTLSETNKLSPGKKIRLVGDLGVVPNRILFHVIEARNDMEHKFTEPSEPTAMNACDVVGLFVAALDMYLFPLFDGVTFTNNNTNQVVRLELTPLSEKDKDDVIDVGITGFPPFSVTSLGETQNYLFLLTYIMHWRRLYNQQQCSFFKKLKYANTHPTGFTDN